MAVFAVLGLGSALLNIVLRILIRREKNRIRGGTASVCPGGDAPRVTGTVVSPRIAWSEDQEKNERELRHRRHSVPAVAYAALSMVLFFLVLDNTTRIIWNSQFIIFIFFASHQGGPGQRRQGRPWLGRGRDPVPPAAPPRPGLGGGPLRRHRPQQEVEGVCREEGGGGDRGRGVGVGGRPVEGRRGAKAAAGKRRLSKEDRHN